MVRDRWLWADGVAELRGRGILHSVSFIRYVVSTMASPATDAPFVFTAGMATPGVDFVGGMGAAGGGSGVGSGAGPAADDLVRQTRREIAEIVRASFARHRA